MVEGPKSPLDLPKDIIEELLMGFSVKSLLMLRCVSKDWNNFISDVGFRRHYHLFQKSMFNAPTGFICHHINIYTANNKFGFNWDVENEFLHLSKNYTEKEQLNPVHFFNQFDNDMGIILAASKGLILLSYHPNKHFFVYDLVSKKQVKHRINPEMGDSILLGFKCEENQATSRNHLLCYKVICLSIPWVQYEKNIRSYNVEIYSSETGTWQKSIMKTKSTFSLQPYFMAKEIRGVFHWFEPFRDLIVAYDCDNSKGYATLIQFPSTNTLIIDREKLKKLEGTKDGSLQFINISYMMINVWNLSTTCGRSYMNEDIIEANKWSFVRSVNLLDIGYNVLFCKDIKRLIGVDPTDTDIIYMEIGDKIYAYNHYEGKVVFTFSQQISSRANVFIHFECPTWPCL